MATKRSPRRSSSSYSRYRRSFWDNCPQTVREILETLFEGKTGALSLCLLVYSIVWAATVMIPTPQNPSFSYSLWWLNIDQKIFAIVLVTAAMVQYYCSLACRCPEWMKLCISLVVFFLIVNLSYRSVVDYVENHTTSLPGDLVVFFISILIVSRRIARVRF